MSSDLESCAKEYSPEITVDDLVIRDLFDISVISDYQDYLAVDGSTITIRFNLCIDAQSLVAILFSEDGVTWEIISEDNIIRNSDSTLDVFLFSEGVLALTFDSQKLTDNQCASHTGETTSGA